MTNSKSVVFAVVMSLAAIAVAVVIGAIVLGVGNHAVPEALWTLAGTAIGGLAALLARTGTEPAAPTFTTLEQFAEPVHPWHATTTSAMAGTSSPGHVEYPVNVVTTDTGTPDAEPGEPSAKETAGKRPAHVPSTGDVKPPYRERSGR